jgi:hypothetical protein
MKQLHRHLEVKVSRRRSRPDHQHGIAKPQRIDVAFNPGARGKGEKRAVEQGARGVRERFDRFRPPGALYRV